MSLAHFSFYPTDYLGDLAVRSCSYEAQGVYVTLLCLMWQAKEGSCSLPLQREKVAKLLGMDVRRWKRIYGELSPLFVADPATCTFTQERLRKEWVKARGLYDRAVKARASRHAKDRGEVGAKSAGSRGEVHERSTHNSEPKCAEKHEIGSKQEPSNQNKNKNQKKINNKPVAPPPGYQQTIAAFDSAFRAFHAGAKPTWNATSGKLVKTLLASHPPDEIARRAALFFSASCPAFVAKGGRDLKAFVGHFDKLAAAPSGGDVGSADGFRELMASTGVRFDGDSEQDTGPPQQGSLLLIPEKAQRHATESR